MAGRLRYAGKLISGALLILSAMLMFSIFLASSSLALDEVISGDSCSFAPKSLSPMGEPLSQGGLIVLWEASHGEPLSSTDWVFNWTAPEVDSPLKVTITLMAATVEGGCISEKEIEVTVRPKIAKISIEKGCIFSPPVMVGHNVTYTYNVTNTGDLPLGNVLLEDVQDWGTGCQPVLVSGDGGFLDPGETWIYHCLYTIPDPSDYIRLRTMGERSARMMLELTQRMLEMRSRLQIKLENLRSLYRRFDSTKAVLSVEHEVRDGIDFTVYRYEHLGSGEILTRWMGPSGVAGFVNYTDPITNSVLITFLGPDGSVESEAYYSPRTKEYLRIEYDKPTRGYRIFTVIDYNTGDTLIILEDAAGNVLNMEYRKIPGYRPFVEKVWARNVAMATAMGPGGETVFDLDNYSLEISKPLPFLSISKRSEHEYVEPGRDLTYFITYKNEDGDAHDVVIQESYPSNVTFKWANPAPDVGINNRWSLGTLAKGESGTITVVVKVASNVAAGMAINNSVNITCRENSSAMALVTTTVTGVRLIINKTASPDPARKNAPLTYTITYANLGTDRARNVTIHDWLDYQYVKFINADPHETGRHNITDDIADHIWWHIGDLNPHDSGSIAVTVDVTGAPDKVSNVYRIDYNNTTGKDFMLITPVLAPGGEIWINKTADKTAYKRGELVNYTILYGNNDPSRKATDVTIWDTLPDVVLESVYPYPTQVSKNLLKWENLPDLDHGENGSILLVVRIPETPKIAFDMSQSVSGEGYVYVNKRLSTSQKKISLVNKVNISAKYVTDTTPQVNTSTSTVTILGEAGTKVITTEHGSGYYQEDEIATLRTSNKSISLQKDIFAQHEKTSFALPGNREVDFDSLWSDRTKVSNYARGDALSESYRYMETVDKNSSFVADLNQTVYSSEAEFSGGMASMAYAKGTAKHADVEMMDDYHGSFRVVQSLDSYGSSVKYAKSSRGSGFAVSEKSSGGLRSYEGGSGYYISEEVMQTGFAKKDSRMVYAPSNQSASGQSINYSSLWREEMSTCDPGEGTYIGEEIREASYIRKESEMGESSLSIFGEFNGTMDIEARKEIAPGNVTIGVEQRLIGHYEMDTAISIAKPAKHLYPHVNATLVAYREDEATILFVINVTNDGNKLLQPINVSAHLCDDLLFFNSSQRPEVNGQWINWTIPSLEIGRTRSIELRAKFVEGNEGFSNAVNVTAFYAGGVVTAEDAVSFHPDWLFCCPGKPEKIEANASAIQTEISSSQWKPGDCMNITYMNVTSQGMDCMGEMDEYYDQLKDCDYICP